LTFDQSCEHVLEVLLLLYLLDFHQFHNSNVLDSELQVVELGQEVDNLLVSKDVLLKLLKSLGNLNVVHVKALVLLVVVLLLLERLHQLILLSKEHLLTSLFEKSGVDFLGENQDIVKRRNGKFSNFELEPLHLFVEILVAVSNLCEAAQAQGLDDGLGGKAEGDLR